MSDENWLYAEPKGQRVQALCALFERSPKRGAPECRPAKKAGAVLKAVQRIERAAKEQQQPARSHSLVQRRVAQWERQLSKPSIIKAAAHFDRRKSPSRDVAPPILRVRSYWENLMKPKVSAKLPDKPGQAMFKAFRTRVAKSIAPPASRAKENVQPARHSAVPLPTKQFNNDRGSENEHENEESDMASHDKNLAGEPRFVSGQESLFAGSQLDKRLSTDFQAYVEELKSRVSENCD